MHPLNKRVNLDTSSSHISNLIYIQFYLMNLFINVIENTTFYNSFQRVLVKTQKIALENGILSKVVLLDWIMSLKKISILQDKK